MTEPGFEPRSFRSPKKYCNHSAKESDCRTLREITTLPDSPNAMVTTVTTTNRLRVDCRWTRVQQVFDCLSKAIEVTVT